MKEIVIISGKGGTGKTTITASLASLIPDKVIADCDVDAADLHLLLDPEIKERNDFYGGVKASIDLDKCTGCGRCLEVCRYDAISSDFIVNDINCEGCGVCPYFCPEDAITLIDRHSGEWYISETRFGPMVHARLGIAEENSGKLVSLIRRQAKTIAEDRGFDTILIDGSPGIGCPVISSITGASIVVVVTEPTISGIHDLKRVISLNQHFKIESVVLINKSDINEEMTGKIRKRAEEQGIEVIGMIPYDPVVTRAMVHKKTVVEFTNSKVAMEIIKAGDVIFNKIR